MKKRFALISIFTCLSIFAFSQSFVRDGKIWNVVKCMNFGGCETISFRVQDDTIINETAYKMLLCATDTTQSTWGKYGTLREMDNRVYFYLFTSESEELLYDFGLKAGDTFISTHNSLQFYGCPIEMKVSQIDTVSIENGEQRRRFVFDTGEEWISGIGSLDGVVYVGIRRCVADLFYDLSCYHEDDELLFMSPNFDHCIVYTLGIGENNLDDEWFVYPNPAGDILNFETNVPQNSYTIEIFNAQGRRLRIIENMQSLYYSVDVSDFTRGTYFYKVEEKNIDVQQGKWVKL